MKKKPFEERSAEYQRQSTLKNGFSMRHRKLMRELIGGATPAQAAIRCNFSANRVSILSNMPEFREEMLKMEDNIDEKFEDNVADDASSVDSLLKGAAPGVSQQLIDGALGKTQLPASQVRCIDSLLDRTGHKAPTEVIATMSVDADAGLKHMLGEMAKEAKEKDATS